MEELVVGGPIVADAGLFGTAPEGPHVSIAPPTIRPAPAVYVMPVPPENALRRGL